MKTNFINDAVELCESILESTSPDNEWGVINLVRSGKSERVERVYNSVTSSHIPQSYYYNYDDIPQFLLDRGVFCGLDSSGAWYVEIGDYYPIYNDDEWLTESKDQVFYGLTVLATKKRWINKGISIDQMNSPGLFNIMEHAIKVLVNDYRRVKSVDEFEANDKRGWIHDGPKGRYHITALIDKKKMRKFLLEIRNNSPVFNEQSGEFTFRGEKLAFSGEKNIAAVKLLVEKINSRVSKKEFYESGGDTNYEQHKNAENLTKINDALSKRFGEIKRKIYDNSVLKASIAFMNDLPAVTSKS